MLHCCGRSRATKLYCEHLVIVGRCSALERTAGACGTIVGRATERPSSSIPDPVRTLMNLKIAGFQRGLPQLAIAAKLERC